LQGQLIAVGVLEGQIEPEGGAHPRFAGHADLGAVLVEDAAHDREA
jgi:hypothetical protein